MSHDVNANSAATFAEFLALPEQDDTINGIHWSLADAGMQFPEDAADLMDSFASDGTDDDLLYSMGELAEKLADATKDLRMVMSAYFEQRGTIKAATEAVEAFIASPTETNRLALVKASDPLGGYNFITMPRELRGKLRPFVAGRMWKSRISFGTLYWIAKDYLKAETEAQKKAA